MLSKQASTLQLLIHSHDTSHLESVCVGVVTDVDSPVAMKQTGLDSVRCCLALVIVCYTP